MGCLRGGIKRLCASLRHALSLKFLIGEISIVAKGRITHRQKVGGLRDPASLNFGVDCIDTVGQTPHCVGSFKTVRIGREGHRLFALL